MGTSQQIATLLVFDVGSTFTKVTGFLENQQGLVRLGRAQAPTTVSDIEAGLDAATKALASQGIAVSQGVKNYASSSAAGGLRMVALGYMPRVTVKAAKEVAMTAGARVLEVLSAEDAEDYRVEVLREIRPDIVLITGGTDGGDAQAQAGHARVVVHAVAKVNQAQQLSSLSPSGSFWKPEVIIGGNREGQEEAAQILRGESIAFRRVPNILPTIHELKVKPARDAIHEQFIRQITRAPGLAKLIDMVEEGRVMPTPGAVLMGAELLAKGVHGQAGLGAILVVDLGGATTDIHSVIPELDALAIEERGLIVSNEKQLSYRTVEGNLGMRVSAGGIVESFSPRGVLSLIEPSRLEKALGCPLDPQSLPALEKRLEEFALNLEAQPDTLVLENLEDPEQQSLESLFDAALATAAVRLALRRHAGHIAAEPNPVLGISPGMPVGRDVRLVNQVIAVGGVFTHWSAGRSLEVLCKAFDDPGLSLLPKDPHFVLDKDYVLYALGVFAQSRPEAAFALGQKVFQLRSNKEEIV